MAIKETVGLNPESCAERLGRVAVVGHVCGTKVEEEVNQVSGSHERKDEGIYFEIAIFTNACGSTGSMERSFNLSLDFCTQHEL
jgi:hypothetical protein